MTNDCLVGLIAVFAFFALIGTMRTMNNIIRWEKEKLLKTGVVQEEHYGEKVWVSRLGESLRKENCLCLQCAYMPNCPFAKSFYDNCHRGNIALMVTRCREWRPKEK